MLLPSVTDQVEREIESTRENTKFLKRRQNDFSIQITASMLTVLIIFSDAILMLKLTFQFFQEIVSV